MVWVPFASSNSSALACARVTPLEPPIKGFPLRSASLGRVFFLCLVLDIRCLLLALSIGASRAAALFARVAGMMTVVFSAAARHPAVLPPRVIGRWLLDP